MRRVDDFLTREWLFFIIWFGLGLIGLPFLLRAASEYFQFNILFSLDAYYQQLLSGDIAPWLTFLIPYGLFVLVRCYRFFGRDGTAEDLEPDWDDE